MELHIILIVYAMCLQVMANSGGNNESVCDVDMANNEFLDTYEYVIKSVQGANDDLKGQIKELRKDVVLIQETNQLRDERDKLIEDQDKLKEERRLLRAERIDLKMDIDHFRREGEADRKKLMQLGIILAEDQFLSASQLILLVDDDRVTRVLE